MKKLFFCIVMLLSLLSVLAEAQEMVKVNRWISPVVGDFVSIPENQGTDAQLTSWGYKEKKFQYEAFLKRPAGDNVAVVNRWEMPFCKEFMLIAEHEISDAQMLQWGYKNKQFLFYAHRTRPLKGTYLAVSRWVNTLPAGNACKDFTLSVTEREMSDEQLTSWGYTSKIVQFYVPGSGGGSRVMTGFNPVDHGFKFGNDFEIEVGFAGVNARFSGQCGGMTYAVLDYYKSGKQVPAQNYRPANGTPLQSYIFNRQQNSLGDNLDKWAELVVNPFGWRTNEFFNWGLQGFNGGRIEELRGVIDNGDPIPLGLFKAGNGGAGPHHQVLAIGYEMGRYKGDLGEFKEDFKLFVFDPNHPDETVTLKPNVGQNSYSYVEYPGESWMTYFVDKKYKPSVPPSLPTRLMPKDGLVQELLLEIRTGGDDLRGGNDNLNAVVNFTDGTTEMINNINKNARWINFYLETVPLVLNQARPLNHIRSISFRTTFGGGIGGDNWNMDRLRIIAREGSNEREVFSQTGAPIVRFDGNNRPFEAVLR